MFNEGDKVRIRSNGDTGTVIYVEDGYISIELTNGVELDFENPDLLMSEDEYQIQQEAATPTRPSGSDKQRFLAAPYVPQKGDRKRAATAIAEIQKIYPGLLDAMRVKDENFDKLDAFAQVKMISEISGTPMLLFMEAPEMGLLRQVIQRTLLNNILEGTDLTMDILLGTAQRIIKEYEGDK